ncbi:hypothetical protein UFOVP74_54 [uncultured Caudovirales phage]|uniref:DUF559 domain-containing protein n=1 Tax=uncultured Caudovirales phage TaxID=2100421 RepID=A0A6J5L218_9CAUD|nr:hypothetical protein UFOVP74_54 [uncultured Caudovirales phage]
MKWTKKHLLQLQAEGKIKGFFAGGNREEQHRKKRKASMGEQLKKQLAVLKEPPGLLYIKRVLDAMGVAYTAELRFDEVRKFRFDLAIPDRMISIEYEGLMSKTSRHTTKTGYTRDSTKYNLATVKGWRVLRYTAGNYREFDNDINKML